MDSDARPQLISSPHNSRFRRWAKLLDAKGIEQFQQCIVFGEKVVREVLQHHSRRCLELVYPEKVPLILPVPSHVRISVAQRVLFNKLDVFKTHFPLLICQIPDILTIEFSGQPKGLELLCPLGDPANVGALIRIAAGMGVQKVILLQEAAHPFLPRAIRAASGAIFDQVLCRGPSIKSLVNIKGLISLDKEGDCLTKFCWPDKIRLLIGQEGEGITNQLPTLRVAVPMEKIESFNAVVATGIALYAYRLQHPSRGFMNT